MKKSRLILVALGMLAMAGTVSCAKQYTCRCETNDGFVTTSEIAEGSKEASAAACEEHEYSTQHELNGQVYYSTNTCELTE